MPNVVLEVTGLTEAIRFFAALPATMDIAAAKSVEKIDADAAKKAVKNAPIRTGQLRKVIKPGKVSILPGTILGGVGVFSAGNYPKTYNGGASFYYVALRMHRYLKPFATGAGYYNLGPRSASQPTTPEGGVGGNYIGRAILNNTGPYSLLIRNVFQALIASSKF